jgi:hypothetical protein
MSDTTQVHPSRTADMDHERIRQLAIEERDAGCREAPEIGRRVAAALSDAFKDAKATDGERQSAYINLVGLAALGARDVAARVLKEIRITVTRQGSVQRVQAGGFLPESVVTNGEAVVSLADDVSSASPTVTARKRKLHVQFDFMSWEMFHVLQSQIDKLEAGVASTRITFGEIGKLESIYPDRTVGDAMRAAGLDPDTLEINLDIVQSTAAGIGSQAI